MAAPILRRRPDLSKRHVDLPTDPRLGLGIPSTSSRKNHLYSYCQACSLKFGTSTLPQMFPKENTIISCGAGRLQVCVLSLLGAGVVEDAGVSIPMTLTPL